MVGTDINAGMLAVAHTAVAGVGASDWREALGAAVAQLDEEGCVALQREVVAAWQPFTEDGTLILQAGTTTVSARR